MNIQSGLRLSILGGAVCLLTFVPISLSAQTLTEALSSHTNTSRFSSVVQQADLESQLNSGERYTIFAPSNSVLESIEERLGRTNNSGLRRFVLNHVITGMASKRQIGIMSHTPSLGGVELNFVLDDEDNIWINDLLVIEYNIRAQNGIIHVLDGTLE